MMDSDVQVQASDAGLGKVACHFRLGIQDTTLVEVV